VFSFRGYTTSQEFALQAEVIARYYVLPLLLDVTPLSDQVESWWLKSCTELAYFFGLHWFSSMSQFSHVINEIKGEHTRRGLTENHNVVFAGANIGGLHAKVLGMLTHHRGIGFISMPSLDEELVYRYEFTDLDKRWVTNVFVSGGYFGVPDVGVGEDYQLSGDRELGGLDTIYQSFCLMVETCGHHNQFEAYCEAARSRETLTEIINFLTPEQVG
jgi:hypothetical protein